LAVNYKFTRYFEEQVLRKRPYLKKAWCFEVLNDYEHVEQQENNRYRFWKRISEAGNRYLRVVTLEDKQTIHNAFFDRSFKN
jgi:hypothetical protein